MYNPTIRRYMNIELLESSSDLFKEFLISNKFEFETSQNNEFIHFEVVCNDYEASYINTYLREVF